MSFRPSTNCEYVTSASIKTQQELIAELDGLRQENLAIKNGLIKDKYQELFDGLPIGLYLSTPDCRLLDCNQAMVDMLGYPDKTTLLKIRTPDLYQIPEDRNRLLKFLTRQGLVRGFEFEAKRYDGSTFWVEEHVRTIEDRDGTLIWQGCFQDIDLRKEAEKELTNFGKYEVLANLAKGIAHDYSNLLAAIRGNIELAKLLNEQEKHCREPLAQALLACDDAAALTQQFMDLSKRVPQFKASVSMAPILYKATEDVFTGSRVNIRFALSDELHTVRADPIQLQNALARILLNARDVSGKKQEVEVGADNICVRESGSQQGILMLNGDYVHIWIKDQGPGIRQKHLNRIFDPYFSTKKQYSRKGIGLGLTLVQSIISRHRGYVYVDSEKGRGTTVHVYLPAAE
ncbi:MAG: PAS domain S-box protein [Desulfohalobiaceae bacterium]|nr:PAS domain S-box protein [Desulfohalobiaceae bacterium]